MFPTLLAASLLSLFGSDWITTGLTVAGIVFAFLGARSLPGKQAGPLGRLAQRASTLLQHVQSLGLPAIAPLVKSVAQGQWDQLPAAVEGLLDQLDDKTQRGGILDTVFDSQLDRQLDNPERRKRLINKLFNRGLSVIDSKPPA